MGSVTKNNRGLSILEVLVAVSIMGILSYGMMEMVTNQNKSIKTAQNSMDLNEIKNQLQRYMLDSKTCADTFGGQIIPENGQISISEIKKVLPASTTIFLSTAAPKNKVGNILVESMTLKRGLGSEVELIVQLKKATTGNSYAGDSFKRSVSLSVQFEPAPDQNKIKNCYSQLESVVDTARGQTCTDIYGAGAWDEALKKCNKPAAAVTTNVYQNNDGSLTLVQPTVTPFHCSNCGGNCGPCPSGWTQISNNCSRGGFCGLNRWRSCHGTCIKGNPNPVGKIFPP
jgi:prepilin-type N-terminal cleavage/methylation domain-containing protein